MKAGRVHMRAIRGANIGWMVTLGMSVCVTATLVASPALALEPSKALICSTGVQAAEAEVSSLPLEPANGATVPAGTPVIFSAGSVPHNAPTFSVASSPTLLSSPDIDSGTGSQSGASYKFTSTKATATPRTIYWAASFTFTVEDCESPSTFMTPVRTLIVAPTEAELAASKKHQEEEATRKKSEEEAAAKRKEEATAASGTVVLDGATINVENSGEAAVKLTCSDVSPCMGTLTLTATATATATAGKGKMRHDKTESIGTASFSIAAGKDATIRITLDKTGRARLNAAHGRLNATLTILRTSPPPNKTQSQHVHLDLEARKTK
jgi:hypothetical protein